MADMTSNESLLDPCFQALGGESGPGHGIVYGRTTLESLEWIQTPGLWGRSPADNGYWQGADLPPASQRLIDGMTDVMGGTSEFLDIASLEPFASGRFEELLTAGLPALARSGNRLTVRILFGSHLLSPESNGSLEAFLGRITARIPAATPGFRVVVGRMATAIQGTAPSWNHAKIMASDGRRAVVGGHNLWSADYFGFAPVHDLSAWITGPGAAEAHRFLDRLWAWMELNASTPSPDASSFSVGWESGRRVPGMLPGMSPQGAAHSAGTSALFLARLGSGVVPDPRLANAVMRVPSDAFRRATRSIRLSQMDLAFGYQGKSYWAPEILQSLADALTHADRRVEIQIALSEPGGVSGSGCPYSWGITLSEVLEQIRLCVAGRTVTGTLRIAPLRFSPSGDSWEHGDRKVLITNHSKLWMVDDRLFYIGSDNLYPHNLQEFGYVVESSTLAGTVLEDYWEPLWNHSSRLAVSLGG